MADHLYPFEMNEGEEEELRRTYPDLYPAPSGSDSDTGEEAGDTGLPDRVVVDSSGRLRYLPPTQAKVSKCSITGARLKNKPRPGPLSKAEIVKNREDRLKPTGPCRSCGDPLGIPTSPFSFNLCRKCYKRHRTTGFFWDAVAAPEGKHIGFTPAMMLNAVLLQQLLFDSMKADTSNRLPHMAWLEAERVIRAKVDTSPLSYLSDSFLKSRWHHYQNSELLGPLIYRKCLHIHPEGLSWHLKREMDHIRPLWSPMFATNSFFATATVLFDIPDHRFVSESNGLPLYPTPATYDRLKHLAIARGTWNFKHRILIGKIGEPARVQHRPKADYGKVQTEVPGRAWVTHPNVMAALGKFISKTMEKAFQPYLEEGETLWDRLEVLWVTRGRTSENYITPARQKELIVRTAEIQRKTNNRPWKSLHRPWMPPEHRLHLPDKWRNKSGVVAGLWEDWPAFRTEILAYRRQ